MFSAGAIILLVNTLSSFLKRWIMPKYGVVGVQLTVFVLSTIAAVYITLKSTYPQLSVFFNALVAVFSLSVSFYEVILQHIPWFKGKTTVDEKLNS